MKITDAAGYPAASGVLEKVYYVIQFEIRKQAGGQVKNQMQNLKPQIYNSELICAILSRLWKK